MYKENAILASLAGGKCEFLLYDGSNLLGHYVAEFLTPEAVSEVARYCDEVQHHKPLLRYCKDALFFDTLQALKGTPDFLRPEDKFLLGWARSYKELLQQFRHVRARVLEYFDPASYAKASLSPQLKLFFDECLSTQFDVETVSKYAVAAYSSTNNLMELISAADSVKDFIPMPASLPLPSIMQMLVQLGSRDPDVTASGRRIPWIGGAHHGFGYFEPTPTAFPAWFDPLDYWDRVPVVLPDWALGALVHQNDVPIERLEKPESWKSLPKAENPAESAAVADNLIEEAIANKRWVVPRRAIVQLPVGPFTHFEVSEYDGEVFFVGRTNRGEFAIFDYELTTKHVSGPLSYYAYYEPENCESTRAALRLLFAAIIRDFWVVENRENVFAAVSVKRLQGVRERESEDNTPRIVYLPRIRYKDKPSAASCAEELDHKLRAAHFVSAHLRKAGTASDLQIRLAQRYGFDVPTGYTFVKPHERGKVARALVYRSRSALQSLYRVDGKSGAPQPEWFRFEKDVQLLMEGLGFEVQHKAASRTGDKGVDLYATKGSDIDIVNWIIQCKCYRNDRAVGPDKIRELHSVVSCHPPGTRGMLVTTSYFTEGAHTLAAELGIRLMDGVEYMSRLQK